MAPVQVKMLQRAERLAREDVHAHSLAHPVGRVGVPLGTLGDLGEQDTGGWVGDGWVLDTVECGWVE